MNAPAAADRARVTLEEVLAALESGELRGRRYGKGWHIEPKDVDAWRRRRGAARLAREWS